MLALVRKKGGIRSVFFSPNTFHNPKQCDFLTCVSAVERFASSPPQVVPLLLLVPPASSTSVHISQAYTVLIILILIITITLNLTLDLSRTLVIRMYLNYSIRAYRCI